MIEANAAWPVSLLWPDQSGRATTQVRAAAIEDLALEHIVQALNSGGQYAGVIRAILCDLCLDPRTIAYRQAILADLLESPELCAALRAMLPELHALATAGGTNWPGDSLLSPVLTRLRELDRYVAAVDRLHSTLEAADGLRSPGLLALQAGIAAVTGDATVEALRAELPRLIETLAGAKSVTIGVNLDMDLEPEAATIVDLNHFQYKGARSLLSRLLPGAASEQPAGVSGLHQTGPAPLRRDSVLFKDLQRLLEAVASPLVKALARYRDVNTRPLAALEREFAFFTGAASLARRLEQVGVSVCRPEVAPAATGICLLDNLRNLALTLQMLDRDGHEVASRSVANDVNFDGATHMLIVTGPNRGGKTTFCRAIGQAQVLFQSGLFVPASAARMSPADGIWTHFPLPEADRPGSGRLDEEVQRLRQIFGEAHDASLILLNEPLTSTSERDALVIARDIVRGFQILGARVVLVTHLHELALSIPALNEAGPANREILSLVAGARSEGERVQGTFRILPGAPEGHSYAAEIARQHGLTFDQLRDLLAARSSDG